MSLAARDAPLRWDWTLSDVDRLTLTVARAQMKRCGLDWEDCRDAAYHGIVEALYTADERPTRTDLFWAGVDMVLTEVRLGRQSWGQRDAEGADYHERGSGPQFARYWLGQRVTPFPDDAICDRLALPRVLSVLTALQYDVLVTVAACDNQKIAADMLGIPYGSLKAQLFEIREHIRRLWMEGEKPAVYRSSETCRAGHPWAKFAKIAAGGQRYCRECRRLYKRRRRATGRPA